MQNSNQHPQRNDAAITTLQQQVEQWSGPLPSPRHLAEFDRVIPGAAERILAQFEKQVSHRMDIEKRVVQSKTRQSSMGSVFGFVIGIFGLWVAKEIVISGHGVAGSTIAAIDLVGLVSVFVLGRKQEAAERGQRRAERSHEIGRAEEPMKR